MEAAWRTCAAFCTPLTQGAFPPRDCDRNISVVLRESECDDPTRCKGNFSRRFAAGGDNRADGRSGRGWPGGHTWVGITPLCDLVVVA